MNAKLVFRLMGLLLLLESASMLLPMLVAMLYREGDWTWFLISALITAAAGGALFFFSRRAQKGIHAREAFALTGFSWLSLSVFGALPAFLSGAVPNFINALFESISGFTTTGATVLTHVESLSHGMHFWRALTHWIGGMGVLILFLALLPSLGERSIQLLRAESPGPTPSKLVPRIGGTAKILYAIYCTLTLVMVLCLTIAGMPLFDSVIHSLSTAGTGGFSSQNASIGAYDSAAIRLIISAFMLMFGINFTFYYYSLRRKRAEIKSNSEMWVYLGIVAATTLLITLNIMTVYLNRGDSPLAAAGDAFFSVSAVITSTGFTTTDYNLWPEFSRILIIILMISGACSGSTAGGVKTIRLMIVFKSIIREVKKIVHPRAVSLIRVSGRVVEEAVVTSTLQFFAAYILLVLLGTLLFSLNGLGTTVSFTAAISSLSNIGPGLGAIGPAGNYAVFSIPSKIIFSLFMLIGRLEIFPILLLFSPGTWRKN